MIWYQYDLILIWSDISIIWYQYDLITNYDLWINYDLIIYYDLWIYCDLIINYDVNTLIRSNPHLFIFHAHNIVPKSLRYPSFPDFSDCNAGAMLIWGTYPNSFFRTAGLLFFRLSHIPLFLFLSCSTLPASPLWVRLREENQGYIWGCSGALQARLQYHLQTSTFCQVIWESWSKSH